MSTTALRRKLIGGMIGLAVLAPGLPVLTSQAAAAPAPRPATKSPATYYIAQPGDFVALIAKFSGVPATTLLTLNRMSAASAIWPGRKLLLPAGALTMPLAVYVVRSGDTLSKIASATKVDAAAIGKLNKITTSTKLVVGRKLTLPLGAVLPVGQKSPLLLPGAKPASSSGGSSATPAAGTAKAPAKPVVTTYVVQPGDFVSRIVNRTGVDPKAFLALNKLTWTSAIHPGQLLKLPGATKPSSSGTTTTTTPGSKPSTGSAGTYTVQHGDFLLRVIRNTGSDRDAFLALNRLTMNSAIHAGQVLKLPKGAKAPPTTTSTAPPTTTSTATAPKPTVPKQTARSYVVHSGDILSGIASRAGVTLAALLAVNNFTESSAIRPGDVIKLPQGAKDPTPGNPTGIPLGTMPASRDEAIARIVEFARQQLGKPYVFVTAGPDTYDCSGLTLAAYRTVGVRLPHYSVAQARMGTAVESIADVQPGDLIFTMSSSSLAPIGHVMIAVSSTMAIHAPRTGDVVRYTKLPASPTAIRRYL